MADISTHHKPDLAHHIRQGIAWLSASAEGEDTAALSYAAFELRFAIERLAVHYWRVLLNRKPAEQDLRDIESFKRIKGRIYELAGHQKEIDGHFEFTRVVLRAMKIDATLHTPQIGRLSSHWHECTSRECRETMSGESSVSRGSRKVRANLYSGRWVPAMPTHSFSPMEPRRAEQDFLPRWSHRTSLHQGREFFRTRSS